MNAPDSARGTTPDSSQIDPADDGRVPSPSQDPPVESVDAYIIPRALAQATLDYLAAHPYREVFALVRAFEALEPMPPETSPPDT